MCDDFEDFNDEKEMLEKSWQKTIDGINKDGYRAGIDAGQEECLQEGFNATFTLSSKLLYAVSELRGIVSGKLSYNLMKPSSLSSDREQLLQTLLGDILEYETDLLKFSNDLYSKLQQEEKAISKTEAGDDSSRSDRLADSEHTDEKLNSDTEHDSDSNHTKLGIGCENELTKNDTKLQSSSHAFKIKHFKGRLETILTSGS